jgi:hypothetical protein
MNRKTFRALFIAASLMIPAVPAQANEYTSWINAEAIAKDPLLPSGCEALPRSHRYDLA